MNKTILFLFASTLPLCAQDLSHMGFVMGPRTPVPSAYELQQQQQKQKQAQESAYERLAIGNSIYRWVGTNVWDVRGNNWATIPNLGEKIRVSEASHHEVAFEILETDAGGWDHDRYIVVTNYPGNGRITIGKVSRPMRLMEIGRANFSGENVAVYDYGVAYVRPSPEPLSPEQIAHQKELAKLSRDAAEQKALEANEAAAAQNDPFGLLRMGERYRDGDGVARDLARARDYLSRAALAGDPTASNDLVTLPAQ